jgi:hypothetical protein
MNSRRGRSAFFESVMDGSHFKKTYFTGGSLTP